MKLKSSLVPALGSLFVLSLSCIFVSAINFHSLLRGLHRNLRTRSLPGSLALVPEEAIGHYQPPPGPIHYGPLPVTDSGTLDTPAMASTAGGADDDDIRYGSGRAMAAAMSLDASEEVPSGIPSVTEVDAMIAKAQMASANKGVPWSLVGLIAPIFVPFLHL
ncbi:hypothetical protein BDW75DRAFT_82552 [Aspergillus navahoensis]